MKNALHVESVIESLLGPETDLEKQLIHHPEFKKGLQWGTPRYGHPEGKVLYHIAEVFSNIEKLKITPHTRQQLRLITLVHDTFKHQEDRSTPRDWSRHHAVIARQFAEKFISDSQVLNVIELHDEAYYSWRLEHMFKQTQEGRNRMQNLLFKIKNYTQLYYLFFKCDTQTGDKNQTPVNWFEQTVKDIDVVSF